MKLTRPQINAHSGMTFFSERGALQAAIATLQGREREMKAENERLRAALADVIPLAGMANLTPESQAKLERAKHVFDSLR